MADRNLGELRRDTGVCLGSSIALAVLFFLGHYSLWIAYYLHGEEWLRGILQAVDMFVLLAPAYFFLSFAVCVRLMEMLVAD